MHRREPFEAREAGCVFWVFFSLEALKYKLLLVFFFGFLNLDFEFGVVFT